VAVAVDLPVHRPGHPCKRPRVFAINVLAGYITAAILYGGVVTVLVSTSPVVEVTEDHSSAGRARLPLAFVGQVQTFHDDEVALGVKVQVIDSSDPARTGLFLLDALPKSRMP
jgi:Protein of unknown function (DUF3093).